MRILELKPSRRKKGRFLLKLEDETILRVTEDELLRFSLRPGMELGEEELEALRASAGASAAKAAAANIIGARALSKKELTSRLVKKGTGQADAEAAAGWLEDIGVLDDAAYAAALVRHYASKGYGPARVREELRRRGVDRELWDAALEELPEDGGQVDAFLRSKLRGRAPDEKEKRRLTNALLRRGFPWGEVKAAWGRLGDTIEGDFETL